MLKMPFLVKDVEARAVEVLASLLNQIPGIKLKAIKRESSRLNHTVDILVHLTASGRRHTLACEVKSSGQPNFVRSAVLQLRNYVSKSAARMTPIVMAPYLSPQAQALCRENDVGFLDFEGNARITFDGVFVERLAPGKPAAERRELRSLFKPKSARILRTMLHDPGRAWKVAELAEVADVSIGHVSNVRSGLLAREWARLSEAGMLLCDPDRLLDHWRDSYTPPAGKRMDFYTTLHGRAFETAARRILGIDSNGGQVILASLSAGQWLSPYGRVGTQYFYSDDAGLKRLRNGLGLSSPAKGENVVVTIPQDDGVFHDVAEPAPGIFCTGLIQTYLDLWTAGERGREAADHLRHEQLRWT